MPKTQDRNEATEVLRDMLIVQLGLADVKQQAIRSIVGCDMHRVTRIMKHLKSKVPPKRRAEGG